MKQLTRSIIILLLAGSCSVFQELASFSKCEFKIGNINRVDFAGINLLHKKTFQDFTMLELADITKEAFKSQIPLRFNLSIDARNPNSQLAALNKIEWIALIDGNEILTGTLNKRVEIPPNNGTASIPLQFEIDLKKVVNKKTAKSLAELALSLMDIGEHSSKLTLRIKPTVLVGNLELVYPGYFNLNKEFSSGKL